MFEQFEDPFVIINFRRNLVGVKKKKERKKETFAPKFSSKS